MTFDLGASIIFFVVCFLYSLTGADHFIKNNKLRLASYIWFPLITPVILLLLFILGQMDSFTWFFIPFWTILGLIASVSALFIKLIIEKYKTRKITS